MGEISRSTVKKSRLFKFLISNLDFVVGGLLRQWDKRTVVVLSWWNSSKLAFALFSEASTFVTVNKYVVK